jgi:hypothetical protein
MENREETDKRSLNEVVINFHSICAQSAKESGAIKYGT